MCITKWNNIIDVSPFNSINKKLRIGKHFYFVFCVKRKEYIGKSNSLLSFSLVLICIIYSKVISKWHRGKNERSGENLFKVGKVLDSQKI